MKKGSLMAVVEKPHPSTSTAATQITLAWRYEASNRALE
jgi:hypothetical protein